IRMSDVFPAELILLGLKERTRQAVVAELVDKFVCVGLVDSRNKASLAQVIMARETMGSTALGKGVALPHCRTNLTDRFMGVIAIDPAGVDFRAVDLALVNILFLLVGPLDERERYFNILQRIRGLLEDKSTRLQLVRARSPADVVAILEEFDAAGGLTTGERAQHA
ncbi:MAG TPA: PTS sugar transporter subunit IIA, partial [Pirellulales bacterium]|nr:PTS sugar transporter subunit IIA [Pirellulales bacterium]